jgi:hypothetical protein
MMSVTLYRWAIGIVVLTSFASLGLQCGTELGDCFGFSSTQLEVKLIGAYSDDYAQYPLGSIITSDVSPCGPIDSFPDPLSFQIVRSYEQGSGRCNAAYASLDVGVVGIESTDWTMFNGAETISHANQSILRHAYAFSDVVAESVVELESGCTGLYTVFLHHDGVIPSDTFTPPDPAVRSYWLVTRAFEPWRGCDAMPPDQSFCADTWVAQVLSRTPR